MIAKPKRQLPLRPARCYAYARVSTDPQAKSGLGLAGQDLRAREYYEKELAPKNVEWVGLFEDKAVSAYKHAFATRKAAGEILRLIEPGDHLLIPRLDRAFRSAKDFLCSLDDWEARGYFVHMPDVGVNTSKPEGAAMARAFAAIRAVFAEVESQIKAQRQLDANLILRMEGRPVGRAPVGWKIVRSATGKKRLIANEEDRAVMMEIVKLRLKGWGFQKISKLLTQQGIMWKRKAKDRRLGYQYEYWTLRRCENACRNMMDILAQEEVARKAAREAAPGQPSRRAEPE